ncbi:MAG: HD domain-containing protein [Bacteroides sp.]|nr:HD domain-containing protein [Prevotella sp.]MCM1407102.1 HD domain-containing protein [Treponema brennaborense]MCM1470254.1 HD domain-containing protein [Bacteroides sp.]
MLQKKLALKIFEAFSIERWNDLIRPFAVIEMDKAAEKMVIAYIVGKYEEHEGRVLDWDWMIHASLFDLLKKIALCDIKSPVQRMIRQEYPDEYKKLDEWVTDSYRNIIGDEILFARFKSYIQNDYAVTPEIRLASRVLRAAHKYATLRELQMIERVNEPFRLRDIERQLNSDMEQFLDLRAIQLLFTKQRPYEFLMIIEQLRFQTRWNQTPRVPATSVLGHSFFVAVFTLLLEYQSGIPFCEKRRYNNFFSALFHDLPESVTRDIISPVKQATKELPEIVKHIEDEIVKKELLPLMEDFYADELRYFTSDEFENRIILTGSDAPRKKSGTSDAMSDILPMCVSFEDLNEKFNSAEYSPVDGRLIRCADHIAAFMEADSSIRHGITSSHLRDGRQNILSLYPAGKPINGADIGAFFAQFDESSSM